MSLYLVFISKYNMYVHIVVSLHLLVECLSKVYRTRKSVFFALLNVDKFVATESLNFLTNKTSQLRIKKIKEADATFVCISLNK